MNWEDGVYLMPRVITEAHQWVVAANIDVSDKQAKYAVRRGNVVVEGPVKVEALLVSCAMCRKPYEAVADEPCPAYVDNRHLIGGRADGSRERPARAAGESDGDEPLRVSV